ncbi:MAG: hypothetical protein V4538_01615 [Bacteroidota bacterium]
MLPNAQFPVRLGVFSTIKKTLNHTKTGPVLSHKITDSDRAFITQFFNAPDQFHYETDIISIEKCFVD